MVKNNQDLALFRQLWIRWRTAVHAARRYRKTGFSRDGYAQLHHELLNACDRCRPWEKQLTDAVANLVSAWGSLESLEHTEPSILRDLESHCAPIDHELHYSPGLGRRLLRAAFTAVILTAVIGTGFAVWWGATTPLTALEYVQDLGAEYYYRAQLQLNLNFNMSFLALFALAVVILGIMMTRFTKKT